MRQTASLQHADQTDLPRIANSEKTIIRFSGRQYYDDWTVPAKDKKAILEMFAAEEAMKEKIASSN